MLIKAAVIRSKGGPFIVEEVELDDPRDDEILVRVIAAGMWALIQFTALRVWHAVLVLVAGFYLALSPAGPQIHEFLARIPALFGH